MRHSIGCALRHRSTQRCACRPGARLQPTPPHHSINGSEDSLKQVQDLDADILLVEDDPNDAELVGRALKRAGAVAAISHVQDGAEALDYLYGRGRFAGRAGRAQPKLVLLDLKLPKLTGLEVLRDIRSNPDLQRLVVVMLTSSREERDLQEAYRSGVNSYVVKAVNFEELMDSLSRLAYYWLRVNQLPQLRKS
ncbi:MAG: response regulator [Burkholderiales bacterium]|nr:response regulator [Burkholderiales bacterium]